MPKTLTKEQFAEDVKKLDEALRLAKLVLRLNNKVNQTSLREKFYSGFKKSRANDDKS